jgi:hypothetical protein
MWNGIPYLQNGGRAVSIRWLKTNIPIVVWGPEAQAMRFGTQGEARRVVAALSSKDLPAGITGYEALER